MKTFKTLDLIISGQYHLDNKLNCQDYALLSKINDVGIGVVADGVGSYKYSEFMSFLIAGTTINYLSKIDYSNIKEIEKFILVNVPNHLKKLKVECAKNFREKEYAEFCGSTLLFFIVTSEYSYIFTQGDGYYGINNDVYKVEGNSRYIENCTLQLEQKIKTDKVQKIWVSTDGMRYATKSLNRLINEENMNDLEDTIKEEENQKILRDDFGIVLAWR